MSQADEHMLNVCFTWQILKTDTAPATHLNIHHTAQELHS